MNKLRSTMKNQFPRFRDFLIIMLFFVVFSIPLSLLQPIIPSNWFILLNYVIPMVLTIYVTRKFFNKKGKFNFSPKYLDLMPLIIVLSYAFLIVGEFTVFLLPKPTGFFKELFDMLNETLEVIFKNKILGFLMVAVAAPILEEILFRGIILKSLLKKYHPWKAILYSSIAFGIFHLNPWQFLYAMVLGVLLGYMYWKTHSLFYPIFIHFLLNGTAFLMAQLVDVKPNEGFVDYWTHNLSQYYVLVALALLIIIISYFILEKYFSKNTKVLILATQNPHKIQEIKKILPSSIRLKMLNDLGFKGKLKETGQTLEENAKQKMRQIAVPYDVDVIADDTGLEVEALNGLPGVFSARYDGENASYQQNVDKLLKEMQGVSNRNAKFRTVIAVSYGNKEYLLEGEIKGKIAEEPRGSYGFGYDSVFIPETYTQTFAELKPEIKNKISHRSKALKKLKELFDKL